ncbi:hypothetical protein [Streptomyces sp. NPDC008001]|uniref:hypothetical protein n=1 Tax=Streptomyces sp. NPDC008001 TaxID=3364804 RepID=UPI0036EFC17E
MLITALTLTIALACAGAFFAFGGYSHWQAEKLLTQTCQGILPRGELESLMMSDDLHGTSERMIEGNAGWLDGCSVKAQEGKKGTTQFGIGWSGQAGMPLSALGRVNFAGDGGTATPIGNGWTGSMTWSGGHGDASVLLACQGMDKSLLVSVRSYRGLIEDEVDQGFGALAKVSTLAAQNAAHKWGCNAQMGDPVHSATAPLKRVRKLPPLHQATGSCRAMIPFASALSSKGIRKVIDTPLDNSLIEDCNLLDAEGNSVYRFSAYYGPYARDLLSTQALPTPSPAGLDQNSGAAWASTQCHNFFGTARFTSGLVYDSAGKASASVDADLQRELLAAFVKGSAERHGCSDVQLP